MINFSKEQRKWLRGSDINKSQIYHSKVGMSNKSHHANAKGCSNFYSKKIKQKQMRLVPSSRKRISFSSSSINVFLSAEKELSFFFHVFCSSSVSSSRINI